MATILTVTHEKIIFMRPLLSFKKMSAFHVTGCLFKFGWWAIVERITSIFSALEKPHRPRVSPMMRTLPINKIKHYLPQPKIISFFLPLFDDKT